MPVIRLEYDNDVVSEDEARELSNAVQQIVIKATGINEVFVYGNSSAIKVHVAPVEIWVEMSANKVEDAESLARSIRSGLSEWKMQCKFPHLINLTLVPVKWNLELDI